MKTKNQTSLPLELNINPGKNTQEVLTLKSNKNQDNKNLPRPKTTFVRRKNSLIKLFKMIN
jgi:hypothetical protein